MAKSARATPGVFDRAVRTVKMDGSMWSLEMLPTEMKEARSYL